MYKNFVFWTKSLIAPPVVDAKLWSIACDACNGQVGSRGQCEHPVQSVSAFMPRTSPTIRCCNTNISSWRKQTDTSQCEHLGLSICPLTQQGVYTCNWTEGTTHKKYFIDNCIVGHMPICRRFETISGQ